MAVTLQTMVTECRRELIDTGGTPRWTDDEFLDYARSFVREVCRLAPQEFAGTVTLSLSQGAVHSLPNDYDALVELTFNADGESIREVDYNTLKASLTWGTVEAGSGGPREYARLPGGEFAVYPVVPALGADVQAVVVDPPAIASINATLDMSDALLPALMQYMIYRARSKDAEDTIMMARATEAYTKYRTLIGAAGEPQSAA